MFLKVTVNKQVKKVEGDCFPHRSRHTDTRITPKFIQNFGEGANSPKGTTKPGNAGSK